MTFKQSVVTWWSVSYFWIVFSFAIASLSTFSFLQVEWVVKRDKIYLQNLRLPNVLSYDRTNGESMNESSLFLAGSSQPNGHFIKDEIVATLSEWEESDDNNEEFEPIQSIKPATFTVLRFGSFGLCMKPNISHPEKCELYSSSKHSLSPWWPVR
jgi:hypothetical protein